jgi:hypothetical protein
VSRLSEGRRTADVLTAAAALVPAALALGFAFGVFVLGLAYRPADVCNGSPIPHAYTVAGRLNAISFRAALATALLDAALFARYRSRGVRRGVWLSLGAVAVATAGFLVTYRFCLE